MISTLHFKELAVSYLSKLKFLVIRTCNMNSGFFCDVDVQSFLASLWKQKGIVR